MSDEDRQRLAALGYVGTQSSAAISRTDARPDPKDKAPLLRSYRLAVEAIGDGRLEEGSRMLRGILDEDPAMTDVWSQYAATLGRLGRFDEAFRAYAQMIKLQPDEANGPLGAASMLLNLNRLDEARAHAELAIASAPSQAHQALALIEVARKHDAEALREADLAAKAEPGLPMPAFIRGTIAYNSGQYDRALAVAARRASGLCATLDAGARSVFHDRRLTGAPRALSGGRTVSEGGDPALPEPCSGARWPGDAVSGDGKDFRGREYAG